jgi:hypothetical protein
MVSNKTDVDREIFISEVGESYPMAAALHSQIVSKAQFPIPHREVHMSQLDTDRRPQENEMTFAKPQKEHQWLQRLVGEWTYETDAAQPDEPASKATGSELVKSLGGLWIVGEGKGEMPGGSSGTTQMTLGYDPDKKRFVGSWVGSMMTHQWVYDGQLDAAERVLTLNSEGPSMSGDGTMAKYQDVIELKGNDRRTLTARVLGNDGKWNQFMTTEYKRTK